MHYSKKKLRSYILYSHAKIELYTTHNCLVDIYPFIHPVSCWFPMKMISIYLAKLTGLELNSPLGKTPQYLVFLFLIDTSSEEIMSKYCGDHILPPGA